MSAPLRVVSLLPSATEIVCAVGAEAELVGVSHECDFPPSVRGRTVLTRPRVPVDGTSRAIDAAVRAVVHDALAVYEVDEVRLAALAPDVVVTQDLCEVCAVSLDDVRAALARVVGGDRVRLLSLRPTRLAHVLEDVERVAAALGREPAGRAVRSELERRIGAIASRVRAAASRPRVVTVEWIDPILLGGTWMPELIELAGGEPAGAAAGEPAPAIEPAALAALRPDVVLVKPCGFPLERALRERATIERTLAPSGARVYVTDGNAYFNRPGPRLVESLEILAACVHPELCADLAAKHAHEIERVA